MSTPTAARRGTVFSLTRDFQRAGSDSFAVKESEREIERDGGGEGGRERCAGPLNPSPGSGLRYHNSAPMAISAPLLRWALAGGRRRWRREIAGPAHGMLRNAAPCKKKKKNTPYATENAHLRRDSGGRAGRNFLLFFFFFHRNRRKQEPRSSRPKP